ncbi:MAG: RHS repeat-associated core domain-containing protein [Propioniciclava sp.]|uniref:RHS repeat-associated core domain-containing protein n=1 Tax=Propioniciclava sp. TaxID=2038686 RepID=UPI0039E328A5
MIGLVAESSTMPNLCATPLSDSTLLARKRTFYDGSTALGQAPTRGLPTRVDELTGSSTRVWSTTATGGFDQHGRPTTTTNALGQVNSVAYAPATGPVTSVTSTSADPDGAGPATPLVSTTAYDPRWGTAIKRVEAGGQTTEAVPDALGRTTSVWAPGRARSESASQKFSYGVNINGVNWVKTESLRVDSSYAVSYAISDSLLRERQSQKLSANEAGGRVITDQRYDSRGLPTFASSYWTVSGSPDGKLVEPKQLADIPAVTQMTFDALERALVATLREYGHEKSKTSMEYTGDLVKVTPPAGGVPTTTAVDVHGRTTALTRHMGASPAATGTTTAYTYTPAGQLRTVTDAQSNVWTYTYDLAGNRLTSSDPDKGLSTSTYDLLGNVTSSSDARGQGVKTTYDGLNRSIKTTNLAGSTTLTSTVWDTVKKGLVTSSTRHVQGAAIVSKVNSYDAAGRATSNSMVVPAITNLVPSQLAGTYTTTQAFNVDGSAKTQGLPALGPVPAETLTHGYDARNNPFSLTGQPATGASTKYVTDAYYTALGEPDTVWFGLSSHGWLGQQTFYEASTRRLTTMNAVLDSVGDLELGTLAYDPAGNITKATAKQGSATDTQCYRYDSLQQLSEAWTPANGNCATNPTQAGLGGPSPYWKSWTADVVGNITKRIDRTVSTSTTTAFAYGAAGQPRPHFTTGAVSTGSVAATRSYGADAVGNTISRAEAGQTQTLAWDTEGKLSSVSVAGNALETNVYDAGGARVLRRESGRTTLYTPVGELTVAHASGALSANRYYSFNGQVVALRSGASLDKVTYTLGDHQGTTHIQVNAQTRVTSTRWSAPYGVPRGTTGGWSGERDFVGGTKDDAVGLIHIGARDFDAHLNRFITTDPLIDPFVVPSLNAYSYANNNPTTLSDPTGLWPTIGDVINGVIAFFQDPIGSVVKAGRYLASLVAGGSKSAGSGRSSGPSKGHAASNSKPPSSGGRSKPRFDAGATFLKAWGGTLDHGDPAVHAGVMKSMVMAPPRAIVFGACMGNQFQEECQSDSWAAATFAGPVEQWFDNLARSMGIQPTEVGYTVGDTGGSILIAVAGAGAGKALSPASYTATNGAAPRFIGNSAGGILDTTRVTIPEGKFGYLLKNPSKSGVFKDSMGFDQAGLDSALRSHLTTNFGNASASVPMTGGGTKFVVRGPLTGPSGQTWNITTAWGVDVDGTVRLITATP